MVIYNDELNALTQPFGPSEWQFDSANVVDFGPDRTLAVAPDEANLVRCPSGFDVGENVTDLMLSIGGTGANPATSKDDGLTAVSEPSLKKRYP